MVKFVLHFLFSRHPCRTSCSADGVSTGARSAGFSAGLRRELACTGVLQLACRRGRAHNFDKTVLSPLTGGRELDQRLRSVGGSSVYRPNALTGDPNHLGIMLIVPLLVLLPVYLRLERGHRWKTWLAVALGFMPPRPALDPFGAAGCSVSASGLLVLALRTGASSGRARSSLRSQASRFLLAYVLYFAVHYFSVVLRLGCRPGAPRARPTSRSTTSSRRSSIRIRCSASG